MFVTTNFNLKFSEEKRSRYVTMFLVSTIFARNKRKKKKRKKNTNVKLMTISDCNFVSLLPLFFEWLASNTSQL